jgi:hypothetical protein
LTNLDDARRSRAPRRVLVGVGVVVVVAVAWVVTTGLIARHDDYQVRDELATLKTYLLKGDLPHAVALERHMQHQADRAHSLTTGPAWWGAAHVPYLGTPAKTARGATQIVAGLTHEALPDAVTARSTLDPKRLRVGDSQIDLAALDRVATALGHASDEVNSQARAAGDLSGSWLGTVTHSRDQLVDELSSLQGTLADAASASKAGLHALGEDGTRRYFLGFQTDAEPRGLGGLPGSWAILETHDGRLSFTKFGSDVDLAHLHANVDLGADYHREYRRMYHVRYQPTRSYLNSDPSPHFPDAAQIWISMWEQRYHQHLDGALTTDPTTLGYLLKATGPVTLSDGMKLNAHNAEPFFEHDIYTKFIDDEGTPRKKYQERAAQAVADAVIHEPGSDLKATGHALRRAVTQRRVLAYSTDPATESLLAKSPLGGALPQTTDPFLGVTVNSVAGGKIGYYLDRSVAYHRPSCGATPVTVTVSLHNAAPTSGLVPYVAGRYALLPKSGSTILVPSLFGTTGATPDSVTVDGKPRHFKTRQEQGHPVMVGPRVLLRPHQTHAITFTMSEPAARGPLTTFEQPGVRPLEETVSMPSCA